MIETETRYQFNGLIYSVEEIKDINGVVTYSCSYLDGSYPVAVRTNGTTMFHFKIGDTENANWECCTSRRKFVKKFTDDAGELDDDEGIVTGRSWYNSAKAVLYYMDWL